MFVQTDAYFDIDAYLKINKGRYGTYHGPFRLLKIFKTASDFQDHID